MGPTYLLVKGPRHQSIAYKVPFTLTSSRRVAQQG
ncbi:hypothetical protein RSAG8_07392, partial [Rhizoctonia solani AG-8 WAC10335]